MRTDLARKAVTHLFIAVGLKEAALGGERVSHGVVVRLVQTLAL